MNYQEFIKAAVNRNSDLPITIEATAPTVDRRDDLPTINSCAVATQFAAESKKPAETGLEFTQEDEFEDPKNITAQDIRAIWDEPILRATVTKLQKFIFEGAELLVVPPDEIANKVKKEELEETQTMVETIDNYAMKTLVRMERAWLDKKRYGTKLFERLDGQIPGISTSYKGPVVFKSLPMHSFDTTPTPLTDTSKYVTGKILKGIVFDLNTFETSYWQRQTDYGEPIQLKNENLLVIKDENSEYVDGDSVFVTLVPLIKKLAFVDKCLMRSAMRTGVPNLDVIIKEFRGEAAPINADAWDLGKAYMEGRKIGQNWSNSTVLTHPDCIELKPMEWGKMGMDPIKVVNFFNERILYALVPRDFTENKGIAISQTGTSSLDMLNLWARGEQTEIERPFLAEWDRILALNGKEGWRVEIVWREMTPDSGPEIWNRVRIARDVGVFTPDEIREIAGYPPLTEDQRAEIARIPAKGSNPGDKVDFGSNNGTDDRADVGPNPPPASFNDPDKKIDGTPQQRDKKDSREVKAKND